MAPRHPSGDFDSANALARPQPLLQFGAVRFGTAGFRETSSTMPEHEKFAVLRTARRIWAVSPVHGDVARLRALHGYVAEQFQDGDRLIYLGGMLGRGSDVAGVVEELVSFRRQILAQPRMFTIDIAY